MPDELPEEQKRRNASKRQQRAAHAWAVFWVAFLCAVFIGVPVIGFGVFLIFAFYGGAWAVTVAVIAVVVIAILVAAAIADAWRSMPQPTTAFDPMSVTRECPHCKSAIRPDASVCPHCQRESDPWTLKDGHWWLSVDGRWNRRNQQTGAWVPIEDQSATPAAPTP